MPTYFVTGTRSGIGLEYVRQLSLSPDNVVVAAVRDVNADISSLQSVISHPDVKAKIHLIQVDLSSPESIASVPSQLLPGLKINALIQNAAALFPATREETLLTMASESLTQHFNVNVIGPALLVQVLVPLLAPGAIIANITSGIGSLSMVSSGRINAELTAYSISKTALNMLTVHQAKALTGKAIVVCVDPGHVKTPMGGPKASVEIADSARGVLKALGGLRSEDACKFYLYNGDTLPW